MLHTERCPWCGTEPLYVDYHDKEWGVPERDSKALFEKLLLDGAQAGLSWWTILSKRENYRQAFYDFDPELMARISNEEIELLLQNKGIVRNRLKVMAFRANAQCYLGMQEQGIDFSDYLWAYVNHEPIVNRFTTLSQVPANTLISDKLSKDLKKRGFKFVGSTIVYAFMQAVGMVNDHLISCPRHVEVQEYY